MKTAHLFAVAAALLGVSAFAAPSTKAETYTVNGFFRRDQPSADLVKRAATELGAKMKGMTQVGDRESADHRVEILFEKDGYKIYVDALPLATAYKDERFHEVHNVYRGDSQERAESARAEAARGNK